MINIWPKIFKITQQIVIDNETMIKLFQIKTTPFVQFLPNQNSLDQQQFSILTNMLQQQNICIAVRISQTSGMIFAQKQDKLYGILFVSGSKFDIMLAKLVELSQQILQKKQQMDLGGLRTNLDKSGMILNEQQLLNMQFQQYKMS